MKRGLRISAMLSLFVLPIISGCSITDKTANEPFRPVDDGRYHPPLPKDAEKTNGPVSPDKRTYRVNDKVCNKGEQYSSKKWQWISWEACADFNQGNHTARVTFTILDAQYYWGGAWYRFRGTEETISKFKVGVKSFNSNIQWEDSKPFGKFTGPTSKFTGDFSSPISSVYKAFGSAHLYLYWTAEPVDCGLNCSTGYTVPNQFESSTKRLNNAIKTSYLSNQPMIYHFSSNNQIPAIYPGFFGSKTSISQEAYLVMIPGFVARKSFPYLFGDTHKGVASRCEKNINAITDDGTRQDAEMWTLSEIFYRFGSPDVFFNGNYFDIRPQQDGQEWQKSRCSTPLGMYFDNYRTGPTKGTHNKKLYFPGPTSFVSEDDDLAPVDTMFFTHTGIGNNPVDLVVNSTEESKEATVRADYLIKNKYTFSAISGTALLSSGDLRKPKPDAGDSATTRIAMAYDKKNDYLLIMTGGSYRNGLRRMEMEAFFRTMPLFNILELDGGGSASLGVNSQKFLFLGSPFPPTSCNLPETIWCAPATQPDGKHRSLPSWIGINIR